MSKAVQNQSVSDIIQVEGIYSKGFGLAPKLVMQDQRISAIGKAIYCYFCSYAGAGKVAFPKLSKILYDLKISKDTFYAHFKPLKKYGFISVEQTRVDGKHSHNVYTILENVPVNAESENKPTPLSQKEANTGLSCSVSPDTVLSDTDLPDSELSDTALPDTDLPDTELPDPELPCTVLPDPELPDTELSDPELPYTVLPDPVISDTNNNSINNNRSKSNRSEKHPPYPPQAEDGRAGKKDAKLPATLTQPCANQNQIDLRSLLSQPSENLMLKTVGGEDESSSSQSMTLAEQRFDEFWAAYPRKIGRKAVLKVWKQLKPDAALHDRILTAINLAKATEQWQRDNGRYIPNPQTWLNQGRWDDVHPTQVKQGSNAISRLMAEIEAEESARNNEIWGDCE